MQINTRLFGEIEIEKEKIICFENGIIGFPECRNFILIFDEAEDGTKKSICWLQSIEEPELALTVIDPLLIKPDYAPKVEDAFLKNLGEFTPDTTYVLVTVTVPKDIKKLSANLKAPIVINTVSRRARQLIVEENVPVKYMIYELLQSQKETGGE
ncbi:MAG: flagellar assembly protein FliW [Lachnospiraceae bacterium]